MTKAIAILGLFALSACARTPADYRPQIVGEPGANFAADLGECRHTAHDLRTQEQILGGFGAAVFAINNRIGPFQSDAGIIDECMRRRGYRVSQRS
jgi:hypothetical protein